MSSKILTAADKAFIVGNNDTMIPRQMSRHLNKDVDAIRLFLKEQNMITAFMKKRLLNTKELSKKDQQFLVKHYSQMTISELARAIQNTNYAVTKFLLQKQLIAKKTTIKNYLGLKNIVSEYKPLKFERPPAEYSNPQWTNY